PGSLTCKWDFYDDGHRCTRAPEPRQGLRGPLREYCGQADEPGQTVHSRVNAWKARKRLLRDAAHTDSAADTGRREPSVTMTRATLTATQLLQSAGAMTDQLEALILGLREALAAATDPAAAEAELAEVRAAADQRVEAADQRAEQAAQRATEAGQLAEAA